jgi:hypothetical protein
VTVERETDVLVIGAGQAGLSAAFHLRRRGFEPGPGFTVLDADASPGGAWAHRPATLTMADVNRFHELPDMPLPAHSAQRPARDVLPVYFDDYEQANDLRVVRPVRVSAVREAGDGRLLAETDAGRWTARALINATGTWTRPFVPYYPGMGLFRGRQLHSSVYTGPEEFAGLRVLVVGGGGSAMQILAETAAVTGTLWATRRPPVFRDEEFTPEIGRTVVAMVERRVRAGLPPASVVSVTGLPATPSLLRARELGALHRLPMFERLTEDGAVWPDGRTERFDVVVWATGFRPEIAHLAPLGLRTARGGIRMAGTRAADDPRVHLVGYGPSASTIGANRGGREAAVAVDRMLAGQRTLLASTYE